MSAARTRAYARVCLWLAWAAPFAVYACSAYRSVGYWDVGEMDTVPWILGIAHPTGFPAYVLTGWLFSHVVAIGSVAFRMSLMSALAMSLAAWAIARTIVEEHDRPGIACAAAWLFAFGEIAWTRATRAEVHAVATLGIAATIWLALRWYRTGDARALLGGAACWAFAVAVHPVALFVAPGLLLLLLARARRVRAAHVGAAIALAIAVLAAFYAYLPLRSAYVTAHRLDPTLSLGLPPGGAFWDNDHPATAHGFVADVTGADFDVASGLQAIVAPSLYAQRGVEYFGAFFAEFMPFVAAFALLGVGTAFARDRVRAIALLLFALASVLFALGYAEESDYQRYFLTSFVVAALFLGEAAAWCTHEFPRRRWVAPAAMALAALVLFWSHRDLFRQPTDDRAAQAVAEVLRVTPNDAILVAPWTYATPLAYAAYVQRATGKRTVVTAWIADVVPYLRGWLAQRPVYVVGPLGGSAGSYTLRRIASVPPIYRVERR